MLCKIIIFFYEINIIYELNNISIFETKWNKLYIKLHYNEMVLNVSLLSKNKQVRICLSSL